jgi:hypothetical protein
MKVDRIEVKSILGARRSRYDEIIFTGFLFLCFPFAGAKMADWHYIDGSCLFSHIGNRTFHFIELSLCIPVSYY